MIPTYTNSFSSSPSFPFELNNEVHDLTHHIPHVSPYNNYQVASSSSNSSCQTFFNISTTNNQDQTGYNYHSQFHQPQHQHEVDNFASGSGSHDHVEKKNKGLKLTLWKKGVKKMKNSDGASMEVSNTTNHTNIKLKLEDQKQHMETDYSSNSSSNNIPIRVCSDCNTTKTPLWRSGPKGPKSLCNACGIRQRKARRAMAAAAAAANGTNFTSTETSTTTTMKIKVQQQKQKITKVNTNHVVPFKKRCKFLSNSNTTTTTPAPAPAPRVESSSSSYNNNNAQQKKKLCFEDFFVNLSNNLAIHRVFPQDEKEAAILLMALSSGLVHG
ncbi:GATA transcription factor 21 [Lycium barbarum]|uniref:GATA transcription factor 21 n=1 Tax=Lycium barbarum TaxID=112863 RepID=UPI00293E778D|nr:GATA transcription factor 21 [Lycium barbarum]